MSTAGIPALVGLLFLENRDVKAMAVSVLCNISEHREVCRHLTAAKAGPILIRMLSSSDDDIQVFYFNLIIFQYYCKILHLKSSRQTLI